MEVKDKVELTTLPFIGKEFSISLEFLMNSIPIGTYGTILHLTLGTNCSKRGDRIPGIWVGVDGVLYIVSDLNPAHAWNSIPQLKDIGTGKWISLDISQRQMDNKVRMVNYKQASDLGTYELSEN